MTLSASDRLDILELLAKADTAASRRDSEAYLALFTDDAILDGQQGNHEGKDAIRHSVMPIWQSEGSASTHLTLNAVITPVEGRSDEASANSTLVILTVGLNVSIRDVSFISQHVVKRNNNWLIKRRTVMNLSIN